MSANNALVIKALKHQMEFAESEDRYTALVGGFGSGKSAAIPFRIIKLLLRYDNPRIAVVSPTHSMYMDTLLPLFREIFGKYNIQYKTKGRPQTWTITTPGLEGEILFRSGRDSTKLAGLNLAAFIIDEFDTMAYSKQVSLWNMLISRIRSVPNGTGAITTTPEGYKLVYDLFVKGRGKDNKIVGKLIKAKTTDNLYITKEFIDDLKSQYPPKLCNAYLNGDFVNLNNAPAYDFVREEHVIDNPEKWKPLKHHLHIGIDFNVNPICAVVGELEPVNYKNKDRLIIFDEIILKNSNTEQLAKKIISKYGEQYDRITVYPDLTSLTKRQTNAPLGISDIMILENFGFEINGNRILRQRDRINTVNGALTHDKVLIMPNCVELIRDLEAADLDDRGGLNKKREVKGKASGHITDAFGYLVERLFPITRINNRTEIVHW